jgi:hypothetical protein
LSFSKQRNKVYNNKTKESTFYVKISESRKVKIFSCMSTPRVDMTETNFKISDTEKV